MKTHRGIQVFVTSLATAAFAMLFVTEAGAQFVQGLRPNPQLSAMTQQQLADLFAQSKPAERLLEKAPNSIPSVFRTMSVNRGPIPVGASGDGGPSASAPAGPAPGGSGGLGVGTQAGGGVSSQPASVTPQNYGSGNLATIFHFNDRLVTGVAAYYPQRPVGYFLFQAADSNWYHCSATLINRSILVTAGHCVHEGGNQAAGWIQSGIFYPARAGGSAPYGAAYASHVITTSGWYNTGALDQGYDVAIVVLHKRNGTSNEIGTYTGWLGFCYRWCLQSYWFMTQLGYPGNYYNGVHMTKSEHVEMSDSKDYQYGTGMRGGSSGGPHVSNIGDIVDSSADKGQFTQRNIVMAVTSWGYISEAPKVQGASSLSGPGNANNFRGMYNWACNISRIRHGAGSCTDLP